MAKCKCGRKMSKYANTCKACHEARMAELHAEAQSIVATGKCPLCGLPLKYNSAITGWWQCSRCTDYPAPEFAQYPKCSFQCFTS